MWENMMNWGGYGGHYGFGFAHMLFWWIPVVVVIVLLVRWISGSRADLAPPTEDRALGILRERFARGEIDKTAFDGLRKDLGG